MAVVEKQDLLTNEIRLAHAFLRRERMASGHHDMEVVLEQRQGLGVSKISLEGEK